MRRLVFVALAVIAFGLLAVAALLLARRLRSTREAGRVDLQPPGSPPHAEPPSPTAGVDVLPDYEVHHEEGEEFRHGAMQHIGEERLSVRPL